MTEPSDFEAGWRQCPPGHAMSQHRTWRYDRHAGLLHAPAAFVYVPVELNRPLPTDEWVRANLVSFVRGEFVEDNQPVPPYPGLPEIAEGQPAPRRLAIDYLKDCETLVYGGYLDGLLERAPGDFASQVHAVLADPRIGNKRNARNISADDIGRLLEPLLQDKLRLRFVLPAFPFKDQNPFRTQSDPSSPDLAEVALLVHMHLTTQALYQVHPHGVDWIILGDGLTYADIFGVNPAAVSDYQARLADWRDWLNVGNTVSIVDLGDLIDRLDGCQSSLGARPFTQIAQSIRTKLQALVSDTTPEAAQAFAVLARGMAWNLNSRPYLDHVQPDELWTALKVIGRPASASASSLVVEIEERARHASIEYATVNLSLRYLDAVNVALPDGIRATIHPKPGQVAAPSIGPSAVFPWNGVPLAPGQAVRPGELVVDGLHAHRGRHGRLAALLDADTGDPFYYVPAN